MKQPLLRILALVFCAASVGCNQQSRAIVVNIDGGVPAFQADPPATYVAKVKNILVGLPPTDDEIKQVTTDPNAIGALIDQWMVLPQYQQKMLVFFELAFQQTQITTADFADMIPPLGLGVGAQIPLLLQSLRESFARTVLSFVASGRPITDAFTTRQLMMTPALMELYAFLDTRRVDDNAVVTDDFASAAANQNLTITLEAAQGPIAIADTLNPASPNYMHWYNPSIGKLTGYADQTCNVDPITAKPDAYFVHNLLYGGVFTHRGPGKSNCPTQYTATGQLLDSDFTTWKLVTIRPPQNAQEPISVFYDLPTLRSTTTLVLKTPRPGFFSTPAFGANWPTNTSNQMRVTLNQTLIVSTGTAVDGTDKTTPPSTPGLDAVHAATPDCYSCHQLLDPTRSILASTWSWFYYPQTDTSYVQQPGLFAFQGVIAPVATIDDFANTLVQHPLVPAAWAQKLCYWVNSAPCAADDPEFQRIVGVFQKSNLSWNALVHELLSSPIVTNTAATRTSTVNGEIIAVSRRDHLCAALNNRLGLSDVCGLDATAGKKTPATTIPQIVGGLPSDGYGRGSPIPVLPNQPTLFYRAGLENICAAVSALVVDAPASGATTQWTSTQPDAAIAGFVGTVMALTPSDPRAAGATTLLKAHYTSALQTGASATAALRSTFVTACLAPSSIGIGL